MDITHAESECIEGYCAFHSHEVGGRVTRHVDVYDPSSAILYGEVVDRYAEHGYPELYEVRWTTRSDRPLGPPVIQRGLLRHGLKKVG